MQKEGAARLGFLLSEAEESVAKEILDRLKCSNKQKIAALATRRGSSFAVTTPQDAGRLAALSGIYSPFALRASVLLGLSDAEAEIWLGESKAPTAISDLAVSGRDMMALGARGAEIGKTLSALLEAAIDSPELNEREALLSLAEKIISEAHKTQNQT